jgi:hypothetical protein
MNDRTSTTASPVNVLVTITAMAASVTLALTLRHTVHAVGRHPGAAATFLGLTLGLQLLTFEVYGRGSIGVSAIGILAAGFALGPAAATAVGFLAAVAHVARKRALRGILPAIFDAANFALAAGAAASVYHLLAESGGTTLLKLAAATLAGATYSLVNHALLCLAMSLAEAVPIRGVWMERFHWARFHFLAFGPLALAATIAYDKVGVIGVLAFALPPGVLAFSVRQYLDRTRAAVEEVREANAELHRANEDLSALAERVRKTHRDTIAALSRSMEAKDLETGGHTERVAAIAVALAVRLGYEGEELEAIEIGALLHDIGKIGVPERILNKPDVLDEEEWRVMRRHPLISDVILSEVDLHPFVRQIARSSHERIDGRGYPDGLSGEAVPLPARIVLVADALDALTSDRPYRAARPLTAALDELRAHSGTQFCPQVVDALESVHAEAPHVLGGDSGLHIVAA